MRPISRYYNFGLTFRWVQDDPFVVVKRGYVVEGKSLVYLSYTGRVPTVDLPGDQVGNDHHTWVASFPINSGDWAKDGTLPAAAIAWARENERLANWNDQTQKPPIPISERR